MRRNKKAIVCGVETGNPFVIENKSVMSHCKRETGANWTSLVYYMYCENHAECGGTLRAVTVQRGSRRLCKSCIRIGIPYLWIYSKVLHVSKNRPQNAASEFTFASFLPFMQDTHCFYCREKLALRVPHNRQKKNGGSQKPNVQLDRKDSRLPYSPENCVSCCARCNYEKGPLLTATEYLMVWADRRGDAKETRRLGLLAIKESQAKAPYKYSDGWRHDTVK